MTPNELDFLMDVKRMRFCQTAYFKSKNVIYLQEAKELEEKIDKKLKVLFEELNITGYITLSYDEVMKQQQEQYKHDQLELKL